MNRPTHQRSAYDWRALAEMHRPQDETAMAAAVRSLVAQGLKPRDIAETLRLDLAAVHRALQEIA